MFTWPKLGRVNTTSGALAGDIVLCSWARLLTLTVPLSTQVYKWVPANCWGNLPNCTEGSALRWTSIPSTGSRNTASCIMLQKPEAAPAAMSQSWLWGFTCFCFSLFGQPLQIVLFETTKIINKLCFFAAGLLRCELSRSINLTHTLYWASIKRVFQHQYKINK